MAIPRKNRGWLREIDAAIEKGLHASRHDLVPEQTLHTYAPEIAARVRGIKDTSVVADMRELCDSMYSHDRAIDEGSPPAPLFHFVSGYIFSHVAAELISEKEADAILEYVNENMTLFYE